MCKRVIVVGITIIIIAILFFIFALKGQSTSELIDFFGYSAVTTFFTLIVADLWLGENSANAFDMPSFYFEDSPINVIVQPFFAFFLVMFCIMKAIVVLVG